MHPKARVRKNDRGAQAVEFAILVPVLLLIVTGLIFFGLVFWSQSTVQQAAREGARYVAICNTDTTCASSANIASKVQNNTPGWLSGTKIVVVSDCVTAGSTTATVSVSYQWKLIGFTQTVTGKASTPCGG